MEVIDEGKANRHVAVTSNFLLNLLTCCPFYDVPLLFSVIRVVC